MDFVIPIITFIVGGAAGFGIGVFYLKNQFSKMQNDPEAIKQMAKQMGYNLNKQQMNQMQKMMNQKRFK